MVVTLDRRQLLLPIAYAALNTFIAQNSTVTLTVNPARLPNRTVGIAYSQTVSASGGTAPYTFAVSAGTLPAGLALNTSTGVISGTPTGTGTSTFTIKATDAAGNSGSRVYMVATAAVASTTVLSTAANGQWGVWGLTDGPRGPYSVELDLWNAGGSYSASVDVNTGTFPNGTTIKWAFPSAYGGNNVYGYPNLSYGIGSADTTPTNHPPSMKIGAFSNLSVTYNITKNFADEDADIMFEIWPCTYPSGAGTPKTNEICFFVHTPPYMSGWILSLGTHYNYSAGGFNAYIANNTGGNPPQICIMPVTAPNGTTPLSLTSGTQTIPVLAVLTSLVSRGYISSNDYIGGVQYGVEIGRNGGSLTFNNIAWTWN
jgi:hypothetical protein